MSRRPLARRCAGFAAAIALCAALGLGLPAGPARGRVLDGFEATGSEPRGPLAPQAVPEIGGPGRITSAGRLWLKATNIGLMGNAYPALSSDPSAQWPGPSGVEHLYYWGLWVGAVRPGETNAGRRYRVSQSTEWRPPTLDAADRIYEAYEGIPGGLREVDDDGDGRYDEEFLDGHDDDGDGAIDEDHAAIGQRAYTFAMSDDTPQATNANFAEQHLPLGLRVRQTVNSFTDATVEDAAAVTYEITNIGPETLDSVYVGFFVDPDVGPLARDGYWRDDVIEPGVPNQRVTEVIGREDPRYDPRTDPTHEGGFCVRSSISTSGFTVTDDDGDGGLSPGASTFLLLDHTTDLKFRAAPRQVGFRAVQFFRSGAPFTQGGPPSVDLERYDALTGGPCARGICVDPDGPDGRRADDWTVLASIGPFPRLEPGQRVFATVALAVLPVDFSAPARDPAAPSTPNRARYGAIYDGALAIQKAYRGREEPPPPGISAPHENGRETPVTAPPGSEIVVEDCHFNADSTGAGRIIRDDETFWMNFDCDYCTGVKGRLPRRWPIDQPPKGPGMRALPGDRRVTIEWDNASETVPDRTSAGLDPNAGRFDVRGYKVYRAAGWTRPRGTTGPAEDQWELVADLALFDPYAPLWDSTDTDFDGLLDGLRPVAPVLLDRETGERMVPAELPPRTDPATGDTLFAQGRREAYDPTCRCVRIATDARIPAYPIGRYRYTDPEVANGFTYFYAVTAVDSTGAPGADGSPGTLRRRESARVAREADGVVPQAATEEGAATRNGGKVFVVPNPYRGSAAWDLEPSPSDPTGTHVDFLNLPPAPWTLRIFTVAGDLVQTIRPEDLQTNGRPQAEGPQDGQASWNLISRNGQDVTSGLYLFSVEAAGGTQRGTFVLIR